MRYAGLLLALGITATCIAQTRPLDTAQSTITIHAYKSGVFSFAGHDHTISALVSNGTIDEAKRAIEFTVNTKDMQVLDPGESDKNKAEIRSTMLGSSLLDADKFPEIKFHSTDIRQLTPTTLDVHGELLLHGVSHPLTLRVTKDGDHYIGQAKLKQTDYGLKPVSVAGGTVKVKDEILIEFSIK
jgi:polyisoprenoid-binding protein YceI